MLSLDFVQEKNGNKIWDWSTSEYFWILHKSWIIMQSKWIFPSLQFWLDSAWIARCNLCCVAWLVIYMLVHSSLSSMSEYFSQKRVGSLSLCWLKKILWSPMFLLTNHNSTGVSTGVSSSWGARCSQYNLPLSLKAKDILQKEISSPFPSAELSSNLNALNLV